MSHRAKVVQYILPRRPLVSALRWAAVSSRAPSRHRSFTPLALIFRRARSANFPTPMRPCYKCRDGEKVVIAPRVAFNIQLTLALGRAAAPLAALSLPKDGTRGSSAPPLPSARVQQAQLLTATTVITEAIARRRWFAVKSAVGGSARRTNSPVSASVNRFADNRSSAAPMPIGFSGEVLPLNLRKPLPSSFVSAARGGSLEQGEGRYSTPITAAPNLLSVLRQKVWAKAWSRMPRSLKRTQTLMSSNFSIGAIAWRHSSVTNYRAQVPEIESGFPSVLPVARIASGGVSAAPLSIGSARAIVQLRHLMLPAAERLAEQRDARGDPLALRPTVPNIPARLMLTSLHSGYQKSQQTVSIDQTGRKGQRWGQRFRLGDFARRDELGWFSPPALQSGYQESQQPESIDHPGRKEQRWGRRLRLGDFARRDELAWFSPLGLRSGYQLPRQPLSIHQPDKKGQHWSRLLWPGDFARRDELGWFSPPALKSGYQQPRQSASIDHPGRKVQRWGRLLQPRDFARRDDLYRASPHRASSAERAVIPVEVVYRDQRVASSPAPKEPTAPAAASPHTPKLDIDRLTRDIERQLEKRIRIERERRGRL